MSSAAAAHTLTPSDLERRLAALDITIARLVHAAGIDRSTWSRWRAGRTSPRLDRWVATIAAFDALVAEATPAPVEVEPEAAGAEPVPLTGSSAPTGVPPSFVPLATARPEAAPGDPRHEPSLSTAAPGVDPIPALREQWLARYHAYCTLCPGTNEEEDAAYDLVTAVEAQAVASRATTLTGAIVSIEWARAEFAENIDTGIIGEKLVLALLDGALGVLKQGEMEARTTPGGSPTLPAAVRLFEAARAGAVEAATAEPTPAEALRWTTEANGAAQARLDRDAQAFRRAGHGHG